MRAFLGVVLMGGFWWGGTRLAVAQGVPLSAADSTDERPSFNQTFGYGKAEVLTPEGKRHTIFIPLNSLGFAGLLPYFRREEDITRFGSQPLFIAVDKVQSISVTATALYLEHLMVKGKRLHILGVRVAEGPVELFNYTQTKQVPVGAFANQVTYLVYPKRHWYLRRQGELVEVSRGNFAEQLTAYFQDDPVVVEALTTKSLGYRDMRTLVGMYNEHRIRANAPSPASSK